MPPLGGLQPAYKNFRPIRAPEGGESACFRRESPDRRKGANGKRLALPPPSHRDCVRLLRSASSAAIHPASSRATGIEAGLRYERRLLQTRWRLEQSTARMSREHEARRSRSQPEVGRLPAKHPNDTIH